MSINIAIDGTSASGKSTIANTLAKRLGYLHLNTGSLYRAYALKMLKNNITAPTYNDVLELIKTTKISVKYVENKQVTLLDGEDVNVLLEDNKVSEIASTISPYKELRDKIVDMQRELASNHNMVMEGRDIATKILPNANYKFFVTASVEVRAKRRYEQLVAKGKNVTYQDILQALKERDDKDTTREYSPLVKADDAVLIDTSNLNVEQSINLIMSYIK